MGARTRLTLRPTPSSTTRPAAARSMGHERSVPSTSHPWRASGTALRPAPQPRSSNRPPPVRCQWLRAKRMSTWFGAERANPATVSGALQDEPANGSRRASPMPSSSSREYRRRMTAVMGPTGASRGPLRVVVDFNRAPFLVIWEVTRACSLSCVHCRADAIARRDPRELSTQEGFRLIEQIRSFGSPPPVLVLTGGDPMWRKDLAALVGHATARGLTVALTPSGTAMATRARLEELKAAGLSRVAVSLDGPDPESHD